MGKNQNNNSIVFQIAYSTVDTGDKTNLDLFGNSANWGQRDPPIKGSILFPLVNIVES